MLSDSGWLGKEMRPVAGKIDKEIFPVMRKQSLPHRTRSGRRTEKLINCAGRNWRARLPRHTASTLKPGRCRFAG